MNIFALTSESDCHSFHEELKCIFGSMDRARTFVQKHYNAKNEWVILDENEYEVTWENKNHQFWWLNVKVYRLIE